MLKRLFLNNFRNFVNTEFRPVGLNLLVGPNSAGKTNLCSALRFLSLSAQGSLQSAALSTFGETWNVQNTYVNSGSTELSVEVSLLLEGETLEFAYRLVFDTDKSDFRCPLFVRSEELRLTSGVFQNDILLEKDVDSFEIDTRLLDEQEFAWKRPDVPSYAEIQVPHGTTILSQLYDTKNNPRAVLFQKYLRSWLYFNFSPDALRLSDIPQDCQFLPYDGANLGSALWDLHNDQPNIERKIIQAVKNVEPKAEFLAFTSPPDSGKVFLYIQDAEGRKFSARSSSDGTMRYLAMAYVIHATQNETQKGQPPPIIIIEEPENGLYVGQLKPLLESIDPSGAGGQFIFTSHNPYFVDLFDANLDGLHIFRPGWPSASIVRPDSETIRGLLDEMSLGELHFREMLA